MRGGEPDVGVAGRVVALVALGLDDHSADPVDEQLAADQLARDLVDRPIEEVRPEGAHRSAVPSSASDPARRLELLGEPGRRRPARRELRVEPRALARGPRSTRRRAAPSDGRAPRGRARRAACPDSIAARTRPPTTPWASRNGIPLRTSRSATSVAATISSAAAAARRSRSKRRPGEQPLGGLEAELDRVDRVEQRLLVLLEVLRVGERQRVQNPEQGRERGARPAATWPAGARPRRGSSSAASGSSPEENASSGSQKPNSLARPDHDLGAEPREVRRADASPRTGSRARSRGWRRRRSSSATGARSRARWRWPRGRAPS